MRRALCGVATALALTGCATYSTCSMPINDTTARIESDGGFSVLPPQSPGWCRGEDRPPKSAPCVLIYKEDNNSKTHSIVVRACRIKVYNSDVAGFADYATKPDIFAEYVTYRLKRANPSDDRMKVLELSAVPDRQFGYCVKEHIKGENHGSWIAPQVLIIEEWGYTCLHPSSITDTIRISFTEKGLAGELDPSLSSVRDEIFKNFKLRPL